MSVRNEAIDLYIRLGLPRTISFLGDLLDSDIHRKWFVPIALFTFLLLKRATVIKFFLLENRVWTEKTYQPRELAPFFPHVGDLPGSVLQASLEDAIAYVRSHLPMAQGRSIEKTQYWLSQETIPPAIVLEPPLQRSPFSDAKGYLLDGNHRAISMALKDKLIRSYVGVLPSNKSMVKPKKTSVHKIEYAQKYFDSSQIQTYKHGLQSFRDQFITSLELDLIKKIAKALFQPSKTTHLDIATGSGRIIRQLEHSFNGSIGLDTSKKMMKFAKSETKISSFFRADSENLPFTTNSFNIVTCFRLFINLSKTGRKKFLFGCKRIIDNQGILIVDNHCNKISITGFLGSLKCRLSTNRNDPFKLYSLMTPFQFDHELQSAGFIPIAKLYSFFPSISHLPFVPKSVKIAIDTCLSKLPIIRSFADLIMIVTCKQ